MKRKNLTEIFLEAAEAIDGNPPDVGEYSCHAVAQAAGVDPWELGGWEASDAALFYFNSAHGGDCWNIDIWRLPIKEMKAVRVLLLCLMAAAWRNLPREKYGL